MDPFHMLGGNDGEKRYSMVEADGIAMNHGKPIIRQRAPSVARTPRTGSDFERIYEALIAYKNNNGDVKVPQKFKIPNPSQDYPAEMWGMNLGKTLHNIRYKHCHASYKPRLLELGVDYEIIRKKPRSSAGGPGAEFEEQRRKAMKTSSNFEHAYDPNDFLSTSPNAKNDLSFSGLVVNYDSDDSEMEDDALDRAYNQVTGNAVIMHPDAIPTVNTMTSPPPIVPKRKKSSSNGFDIIYKCLLVYKDLNGHLMVPKRYVIPEKPEYPKEAWGMKIGHSVCNIRNIGSYNEHRDKLEAIGFTFKANLDNHPPHPAAMSGDVLQLQQQHQLHQQQQQQHHHHLLQQQQLQQQHHHQFA